MKKYYVGIDIGGTKIKFGLFDNEVLIKLWDIETNTENNGEYIIKDAVNSLVDTLKSENMEIDQVLGIGVGVPGIVKNGEVIYAANIFWKNKNVIKEMQDLTKIKNIKCINDANAATLGEQWKGEAKKYNNFVFITLGTGIGGGIIIDGKLQEGAFGAAGEFGHMYLEDAKNYTCNCGKSGCAELVASANGMPRVAKDLINELKDENIDKSQYESTKNIWILVENGDKIAIKVAEVFGKNIGILLSNISAALNPEAIIIGGGMSKSGPVVIDYIRKYFDKYSYMGCKDTIIEAASLDNKAGIYGLAKIVMDK